MGESVSCCELGSSGTVTRMLSVVTAEADGSGVSVVEAADGASGVDVTFSEATRDVVLFCSGPGAFRTFSAVGASMSEMGMEALFADMEVELSPPPSSLSTILLLIPDDGSRRRFSLVLAIFLFVPVMVESAEDINNSSGARSIVRIIIARLAERADDDGPCLRDDDLCDCDLRALLRRSARWSGIPPNMVSLAAVGGGDMVGCAGADWAASDTRRPQSVLEQQERYMHNMYRFAWSRTCDQPTA